MISEILLLLALTGQTVPCADTITPQLTIVQEMEACRTETSETYLLSDGTYVSYYYPQAESETEPASALSFIDYGYTDYSGGYIRDKFRNTVLSAMYEGSSEVYLQAGKYEAIYELKLPDDLFYSHVLGATLFLTASYIAAETLIAEEITNASYDQIDGSTVLTTKSVGAFERSGTKFTLNIRNAVWNTLEKSRYTLPLKVSIPAGETGLTKLHSTEASGYQPVYEIHRSTLGETYYGCAPDYVRCTHASTNCMGYALGVEESIQPFEGNIDYKKYYAPGYDEAIGPDTWSNMPINSITFNYLIIPRLEDELDRYVSWRRVANNSEPIYSHERRIAFRVKNYSAYDGYNKKLDFHFIWQCSDGSWAYKWNRSTDSYHPAVGNFPENEVFWQSSDSPYNSPIVYFAITGNRCVQG